MKKVVVFLFLIVPILFACSSFTGKEEQASKKSKGFTVIELFSSEGCSSCPPAESLMSKLIRKADSDSLPLYIIDFHVDYWDYLGWKDTLANPQYTKRQQEYGDYFKLSSIYTPQAIINGKSEIVGSDEEKINTAIDREIKQTSSLKLNCSLTKVEGQKIEMQYTITGDIANSSLNFALVESGITVNVQRGENAHKTLVHDNAARVFKSIKLNSAEGEIALNATHINLTHCKLICFVQNAANMNILAATQLQVVSK
jgi:hypothetical protein